jgi:hypothetical protein
VRERKLSLGPSPGVLTLGSRVGDLVAPQSRDSAATGGQPSLLAVAAGEEWISERLPTGRGSAPGQGSMNPKD